METCPARLLLEVVDELQPPRMVRSKNRPYSTTENLEHGELERLSYRAFMQHQFLPNALGPPKIRVLGHDGHAN